ncbi:MAG: adenine phosphoribosyltransferase [Planctomycetes bacterium]|nr:adenine phosphoribosyltransferase [Planctomycetota bacterium]
MEYVKKLIRDVPDFPKKGIVFKDITPLLGDAKAFARVIGAFAERIEGKGITKIVAIESRGFIFGAALALKMGLGFVPVRKPGKLPYQTVRESYALEYGTDAIEMHRDAVQPGERVALVDDLLATGGTLAACVKLVKRVGGDPIVSLLVVELSFLNGRQKLEGHEVHTLITF